MARFIERLSDAAGMCFMAVVATVAGVCYAALIMSVIAMPVLLAWALLHFVGVF